MSKGKVIMSVSGGADSTTLMAYLLDQGYEVHGVWFDYGSKHNPYEMKAIEAVTNYYKVPLTKVDLKTAMQSFKSNLMKSGEEIPEGYYEESNMSLTVVPARNIIFASIATGLAWSVGADAVALGVHAGDHCFTKDTKILTPEGPKTVEELKVGDAIYSVDENGNIMEDKVVDILKKNVVDYVKEIDTTAGKIRLTDEHEVYVVEFTDFDANQGYTKKLVKKRVKDLTEEDVMLIPCKPMNIKPKQPPKPLSKIIPEILDKYNVEYEVDIDKATFKKSEFPTDSIDKKAFVRWIAWYVAEGWYYGGKQGVDRYTWTGKSGSESRFQATFSQSLAANPGKVELIMRDLQALGIKAKYEFTAYKNGKPREVTFYFSGIAAAILREFGGYSKTKELPQWFMDWLLADSELAEEFMYVMSLGDGFEIFGGNSAGLCSTSEKLLEQFALIAMNNGYIVKKTKSQGEANYVIFSKFGRKSALVNLNDVCQATIREIREVKYGDHVYDISVEKNHNFFAGEWANLLISNSIYPDCRPEFLYPMSTAIWEGTDKKVKLIAPFLFHTKADLIGIGLKLGVPYELTRTCYKDQEKPCGRCGACVERQEAFWLNGTKDPLEYEDDQYWKTVSKAYQEKSG